ncbi:DDE-type integrase/transposase/recombinase [Candidatus Bipolaricaulota bacterium]|nr:DDE-type integrase/transposase/recombinase [Candidatus Bipolaricaulota bacterium]
MAKDVLQEAPQFAQGGWKLRRVLTDWGSEFKGEFDRACRELGIVHTRTKPRHAWTNGFVERLQRTILHVKHCGVRSCDHASVSGIVWKLMIAGAYLQDLTPSRR